jgi:hypothetical protein
MAVILILHRPIRVSDLAQDGLPSVRDRPTLLKPPSIWRPRPASFPDNTRTLTDNAVDAFLAILTNGKVTGDKVGPHRDLLAEFPYLARRTTPDG